MHRVALQAMIAAVLAGTTQAQRPDSLRAPDTTRLHPVSVTEARAVGAVGGASAVVIKADELRSSPAPLLEEALRESPFVHVRQNSRGEMELSIRGSDSRQAAVLLDGVPITLGWDHRADPSLVPITGADDLVIVRGLASLLNGPNTLGGTVEVSHDQTFGRLRNGRVWGGAGVDENAAYVASIGGGRDFGSGSTGVTIRGGLAHRNREGFTLAENAPDPTASDGLRTNSDLRETDLFAALRWSGAMGRAAGLTLSGFNAERGVPPEEHLASPRLWRYPFNRRALVAVSASAGTFTTPLGFATLDVGAGYNAGRLRIDSYSDRTYSTVAASESGDERTLTARARFTHSLPGGASLKAAGTTALVAYDETLPSTPVAEYAQRLWSGGAELEIPVRGSTELSGGLVYDRSTSPKTGGRTPGQPPFDDIGWRAGITHELDATTRLHASASQRSRFPALRELYSGALDRFSPNPSLRPESLVGFEAGVTVDRSIGPIPDATLQLNAFHHTLDDAVVRITLPDRRFQRINRDRIESAGLEALAGVALGRDRERAVTLTGDALVQRIRIFDETDAGAMRHAENNPETRAMMELGVPLPVRLRGFANARYTGRQYCLNSDSGSEMRLDAQVESNFALERRFAVGGGGAIRGLRALLALDNAGNTAIYDQCGLPQPGRTLRAMITIQ